ncbi:DUF4160 domain-containing protein [Pelodictyon phaeoclathratiforme]|uniref:Transcriptional regulator n=1 Tax=Pelodictyon phaeoclathratiforme (strain DSM 5477 / BU-1) TaxID=324925 RepID=B4SEU0_PELPB|nr:DUF4160 domain-containing protein [Pelodictyon phaeoclathratiforme]ACF44616.1 conserved hypothetical protein [Pelodictyon phaeoclathratiforme BU-1]MBV5288962.1 DUF4160 domain-containing protein [Pelodictyon phaeoclathratiforme]
MPEISRFFGIIIRMFHQEHNPPHFHAEFQGKKAVFDFQGNILRGDLGSKTAVKLVREWVDLRVAELETDWRLAMTGQEIKKIEPLD